MKISEVMGVDLPDSSNPAVEGTGEQEGEQEQEQEVMLPGSEKAQPGEQEKYDKFVMSGIKVISDKTEDILNMLKQGEENPANSIAKVTFTIVIALDEKAGGNIPGDIMLHGSAEILENIAEMANEAGIFNVDETLQNKAAQELVIMLADQYGWDENEISNVINSLSPEAKQTVMQQGEYAG